MLSCERAQSSNDKLLKELEKLKMENMELNSAKNYAERELVCYKKKVDDLDLRVTQLEGELKMLMKMQRHKSCDNTFHLPVDLLVAILSRLPVKSLLRFSVVCKTWKSIIKSSNFIFKHLKQYPLNPNLTYSSLNVFSNWGNEPAKVYHTCFSYENALCKPVNVDFSYLGPTDYLVIVGVSDGLVCVRLSDKECDFVISNPATRQFNRIPPCQQWNIYYEYGWVVFGFGTHPSADDYKLVRITCIYNTYSSGFVHQADIYSMSSNDWSVVDLYKSLGRKYVSYKPYEEFVAINGVFYWEAESSDGTFIVAFDVNDCVLKIIDIPKFFDYTPGIIRLKEEVAIIVNTYVGRSYVCHVWVLNAITNCWSKKFKFKMPSELGFHSISFKGSTKNGDLVFQETDAIFGTEIYLYDRMRKQKKRLPFRMEAPCCIFKRNYVYVESLLPVKNKGRSEKSWC